MFCLILPVTSRVCCMFSKLLSDVLHKCFCWIYYADDSKSFMSIRIPDCPNDSSNGKLFSNILIFRSLRGEWAYSRRPQPLSASSRTTRPRMCTRRFGRGYKSFICTTFSNRLFISDFGRTFSLLTRWNVVILKMPLFSGNLLNGGSYADGSVGIDSGDFRLHED